MLVLILVLVLVLVLERGRVNCLGSNWMARVSRRF